VTAIFQVFVYNAAFAWFMEFIDVWYWIRVFKRKRIYKEDEIKMTQKQLNR